MLNFGFIGLGLIGGSLAKSLRKKYPDCKITVCTRHPGSLDQAFRSGIIDSLSDTVGEEFASCSIVFLCVPVLAAFEYLKILKRVISPECVLTDVGSVKEPLHEAVKKEGLSHYFIGGHPMAGSQKNGFENSSAELIEGCVYILTTDEFSDKNKADMLERILSDLGCRVCMTTPAEHDKAVAGISHLPHLAAAALVRTVEKNDSESKLMRRFASSGFKDTTRIAASSPEVWSQICSANRKNTSDMIGKYIKELSYIKDVLDRDEKNEIFKLFDDSREYLKGQ